MANHPSPIRPYMLGSLARRSARENGDFGSRARMVHATARRHELASPFLTSEDIGSVPDELSDQPAVGFLGGRDPFSLFPNSGRGGSGAPTALPGSALARKSFSQDGLGDTEQIVPPLFEGTVSHPLDLLERLVPAQRFTRHISIESGTEPARRRTGRLVCEQEDTDSHRQDENDQNARLTPPCRRRTGRATRGAYATAAPSSSVRPGATGRADSSDPLLAP